MKELVAIALVSLEAGYTDFCLPWESSIDEAIKQVKEDLRK